MRRTSNIQHRTPNIEVRDTRPGQLSTFDVQCSVFDVSSFPYERSEFRLPSVAEKPRFHLCSRAHACPRHWGEHGHLQHCQRRLVATVAVHPTGAVDPPLQWFDATAETSNSRLTSLLP